MIKLVNFLLFVEKIIEYDNGDVDKGEIPLLIYKICSCIRETYCLSYAIRKENNLLLYFKENLILIKFQGTELKHLSSDERSQALLLKKALDKIDTRSKNDTDGWLKSTPGIYVRKFNREALFIFWLYLENSKNIAIILNSIFPLELNYFYNTFNFPNIAKFKSIENLSQTFFIIPINASNNSSLINFLRSVAESFPSMLERVNLIPLRKIKAPEDKILYVNFQIDKKNVQIKDKN